MRIRVGSPVCGVETVAVRRVSYRTSYFSPDGFQLPILDPAVSARLRLSSLKLSEWSVSIVDLASFYFKLFSNSKPTATIDHHDSPLLSSQTFLMRMH
jgi:ABC-type uncharacterized transport system YnjBCD permease subunit